jgi:hypothetical protein
MKYFAPLLLSWTILASCNQDEPPAIPGGSGVKLDYYVESYDIQSLGFLPQVKVVYDYNASGALVKYTVFGYSQDSQSLEELNYFTLSYKNDQVDSMRGYFKGEISPYVEYSYHYLADGRVSKITEANHSAVVDSEANFSYNSPDDIVRVSYTFSNGGSFEYEFNYSGGDILSDKTTRGTTLCSEGQFTYDQHLNPLHELGYIDYSLTNLSANNRLTEDVAYLDCAFPALVPQSYAYEYNSSGYPTVVTTSYKSGSDIKTSRKEFFYK